MLISRLHHTFFGGRWYRRWAAWTIFVLALRSQGLASGEPERTSAGGAQANAAVTYENSAPGIAYVGSKVCAGCHQNVYDQYIKTDMGRSMSEVAPSELKKIPTSITIFDKKLDRYFQVSRDASGSYQTEYGLNPDGSLAFKDTRKIEYLMGSGHNGFSCIVRQGNYLFEAPLSFYTRDKTWGLSPGYESQDYGFGRPILVGCAICHSGLPEPDRHAAGAYRDPPFRELTIGCENCHGPAELHVNERMRGDPIPADAIDRSIVNPAKLQPWLANNICMNCHQGGDARVLQPGKNYSDFRPGKPLDETLAIFMIPFKRESPPQSDLLQHYLLMILSKCYQGSSGKLSCLTCHDPHFQPSAQEAPAYYRKKCLGCHTEKNCAAPLPIRLHKNPPDDCAGCHMLKRDVKAIAHSAPLTNHRIVAQAEEPYPEIAFHLTAPALPDLVHLTAVPGGQDEVPPSTLLEAYGELAKQQPSYLPRYWSLVDELARSEPDNVLVLEALAQRALNEGTPQGTEAAIRYCLRAIKQGSTSAADYQLLAGLLVSTGRVTQALHALERGINLNPYDLELYKSLATGYLALDRRAEAAQTVKRALQLFPQDAAIRALWKKVEAASSAEGPNGP